MQDQLRALIADHCDWLGEQVTAIADALLTADGGIVAEQDVVLRARETTHQITGTTGTMGFGAIGHLAAELEDALAAMAETGSFEDEVACAQIGALLAQLRMQAATMTPEQSSLFHKDLSALAGG